MPHIAEVGGGMNVLPRKIDQLGSIKTFRAPAGAHTVQGLHSFMIMKGCAELREVQYQVANRNALNIEQHRAYVVATSPKQLQLREGRIDDEIYTVFVHLKLQGRDLTDLLPEVASTLSIRWDNTHEGQFEDPRIRWRGPVIQPSTADLDGCHFAMFAHAKKQSVLQKAYPSIQDAKRAGGVPIHLTYEMKDGITEEMQAAFRAMFKPELRQFALMLKGRYDEAVKVTRKRNKITFPLKSKDFERTPAEKKVYDEWVDWVFSQSDESGQTKWCLNKEQLLVISKLTKGEPINIIQGPPGTGKSLSGACCIWALLAAGSGEGKILVVASSNEATDAIARKITETRPKDGQWDDNLMIRLHVESAEYHYARAHADTDEENHPVAERCNQESERVRNIKATFQVASLHEFTTDKMQQLSNSAKQAHVRHIALHGMSLAEAIWKETSNIWHALEDIPANERSSDENKAIEAAISYRGVLKEFRGELLTVTRKENFATHISSLRNMS
jgi:AAA domain